MRVLFVPARARAEIDFSKLKEAALPKRLGLVATIQFTAYLPNLKELLSRQGIKTFIAQAKLLEPGQVLGCDVRAAEALKTKVDAFLFLGSGSFHPLQIALATQKPVYCFDPLTLTFFRLDEKEVARVRAKQKTAQLKILSAEALGLLVSIKPGQLRLKEALALKKKLKRQGKYCYIFLFDNFQPEQLEHWPQLAWINFACPGLSLEQPLAWFERIKF